MSAPISSTSPRTIVRNRVSRSGDGIAVEKGRGTLVARNVVVRARGVGIRLGFAQIGGVNNVLRRNLVRASGDDGFLVANGDNHSLLRRNLAIGAGDDGFDAIAARPS